MQNALPDTRTVHAGKPVQVPELPEFKAFRTMGTYRYKTPVERAAFRAQIETGAPLPTPPGFSLSKRAGQSNSVVQLSARQASMHMAICRALFFPSASFGSSSRPKYRLSTVSIFSRNCPPSTEHCTKTLHIL